MCKIIAVANQKGGVGKTSTTSNLGIGLAKVEELEKCNYNMIDNLLNNEKPREEQERRSGRISIKEKLAEKKAAIRQRDKLEKEKGTEKKTGREI